VEHMVGLFINSLPVRVKVPEDEPLASWLQQLQAGMVELREYEYSSLVEVQGWSEIPRGTPLFDSLVVVQNTPVAEGSRGRSGGPSIRPSGGEAAAGFPLLLLAVPGRELRLTLSFSADRYDAGDIEQLLARLARLLEELAADPMRPVSSVSLVTESDRPQSLTD